MRDNKGKFIKGYRSGIKTEFKKGQVPHNWNRLNKVCLTCNTVYTVNLFRFETSKFCSKRCQFVYKSRFKTWQGTQKEYYKLHHWVRNNKGKPKICSRCGSTKNPQWANKSHLYKRVLSDWFVLCSRCHVNYDKDWRVQKSIA